MNIRLSLSLSLSLFSLSFSLSLTHSFILSLSLSHTLFLSLSVSHTHSRPVSVFSLVLYMFTYVCPCIHIPFSQSIHAYVFHYISCLINLFYLQLLLSYCIATYAYTNTQIHIRVSPFVCLVTVFFCFSSPFLIISVSNFYVLFKPKKKFHSQPRVDNNSNSLLCLCMCVCGCVRASVYVAKQTNNWTDNTKYTTRNKSESDSRRYYIHNVSFSFHAYGSRFKIILSLLLFLSLSIIWFELSKMSLKNDAFYSGNWMSHLQTVFSLKCLEMSQRNRVI